MLGIKSLTRVLANIANLITRTKGLDDTHDDLGSHETAQATSRTAIGDIEGATSLHNKLTAARAALLDEITALRLAELDASNIPANIDTLLTRVTAAVALASICTEARLAELDAGNIPTDLATIKGYLDTEIAAILAAVDTEVAAILADVTGIAGAAMRGTDGAALAASWTAALATALGSYTAALATALGSYTAAKAAFLDEAISAAKVPKSDDESGSFTYTTGYGTNETDISALFTTALTGITRRKYSLYLDLTNFEADANFANLGIAVKTKVDGTNYRAIDRKVITKADIAAIAEPGVVIEIPAVSQDVQITFKLDVALASNRVVNYHYVKEFLE